MMQYDPAIPRAGVIGYPVAHSLSPLIMQTWLEWCEIDGDYQRIEVKPEMFDLWFQDFKESNLRGVNITLPYKEKVAQLPCRQSDRVEAIGAANLLYRDSDGNLYTDNTDVIGIELAISNTLSTQQDKPVCLIGAGGAARAALWVLKEASFRSIRILNRTPEKAEHLLEELDCIGEVYSLDQIDDAIDECGLVINATSLGMSHTQDLEVDLSCVASDATVFDMVYAPLETDLLSAARFRGLHAVDGLEMLIGQARPSFEVFFGRTAPSEKDCPLRTLLEKRLADRS